MRSKPRGMAGAVCATTGAAEPAVARVAAASEARMRDIAAIPLKAARVCADGWTDAPKLWHKMRRLVYRAATFGKVGCNPSRRRPQAAVTAAPRHRDKR